MPHQTIFPRTQASEASHWGKGPSAKAAGEPSLIFDALAARFAPLAAAARQHPTRSLELSCAKSADVLASRVQSVGTSSVSAPTFTNGRYSCFRPPTAHASLSAPVVEGAGRDLAADQGVDLRLAGAACDFHVVIEVSSGVLVSGVVARRRPSTC